MDWETTAHIQGIEMYEINSGSESLHVRICYGMKEDGSLIKHYTSFTTLGPTIFHTFYTLLTHSIYYQLELW